MQEIQSRTSTPWLALLAAGVLSACASDPRLPTGAPEPSAPAQWQAPLPHNGQINELKQWWQQFNDPLLTKLIEAAENVSPTLAAAQSRLEQSRAAQVGAKAILTPNIDANASASRGKPDLLTPLGTSASAGVHASWEIDLFGGNRSALRASRARLSAAQALWHEARVSVAAEVASRYLSQRACEAQLVHTQADAESRTQTARLTELSTKSGLQSEANFSLARASAAQSSSQLTAQRTQCDINLKAMVALTGQDETQLRSELKQGTASMPQPAQWAVKSVPAEVLNQRPDLFAAAQEVVAASADVSKVKADRYPRINLAGSIGGMRLESGGSSTSGSTWTVGPVVVSLPLFDSGRRAANVEAAKARYNEAAVTYRAEVRDAVREVEEALVRLQSSTTRRIDVQTSVDGFSASLNATEKRFKSGLTSLFELEDSRRNALQAQSAWVELQREHVAAWIALYRAVGGGWLAPQNQNSIPG